MRPREPHSSGDGKPLLWASELGKCPRAAMLRVTGVGEPAPPETRMMLYARAGIMWENDTTEAMKWRYGDAVNDQLVLKNDHWSGRCDFVLYHDDPDKQTVLIEHKAKGSKWFNYNNELPETNHVAQLYTYWHVYKEQFGTEPLLVLFYRSWGHYAEFYISICDGYVMIDGIVDGQATTKRRIIDLDGMRLELESYHDSGELPPVLLDKSQGCTWNGEPSCKFYRHCWGNDKGKPETAESKPEEILFF